SWMEDQEAYVERLVRRHEGVAAAALEDVDALHAAVLAAADRGPLRSAPARVVSAQRLVAAAILECLDGPPPRPEPPGVLPLVPAEGGGGVAGSDGAPAAALRVWRGAVPPPERLAREGVAVLLMPTWGQEMTASARWLRSYEGGRAGVLCHPLQHASADQGL